ncbi:hypothetical protein T4C_8557 [Trichinella pseudospiralis]|uniref:Uncharacterized protein n=1 Tax=Trichinella pseudospiralis TaxID=6337 RepID=A0A0V1JQ21_TRIPS|nr:hypothetical protein T4C_8557 [Trichinella pseudospiralis]
MAGSCRKPVESQAPAPGCLSPLDPSLPRLQAGILLSSISAPAPFDRLGSRLRPPCRRGNLPLRGFHPARKRGRGRSGDNPRARFERPEGSDGLGRAPVVGKVSPWTADAGAGGAAGDIRPLRTSDSFGILSPDGRSLSTCSKRPFHGTYSSEPSIRRPEIAGNLSRRGRPRRTGRLVTNAAADDVTRSRPFFLAFFNSFRVASPPFSSLDASGLNSSGGDSESACSWANSRNFSKLSSDSGPDPTFKSQALCSLRGNFSFSPGIRASLHGSSPAWGSLPIAARHLSCLVISSTKVWMPCLVISRHSGAFHKARRCARATIFGRPKRFCKMSTACG